MMDSSARPRDPLRIVTVCSHNRTRSVMTMAMLQRMLDERLGAGAAVVTSLGFGPEGLASIRDAVDAMARRDLDTSGHRSRKVTKENIEPADLVLTAERDHVIKIASISRDAYRRSMTLPEFLQLASLDDPIPGESLRDWAAELTAQRVPRDYISGGVEEIADPTGSARRAFEQSVVGMEYMCERATAFIANVVEPEPTRSRFDFD